MGWWVSKKDKEVPTSGAPLPASADAPKKKICCACPGTKKLRDECIILHTEDHPYCKALIEAHKECLRLEGFEV